MRVKTITLPEIEDILREALQDRATYNPDTKKFEKLNTDKELSVDFLISKFLKISLETKENLIIPLDAEFKGSQVILKNVLELDDFDFHRLYKEFYAHQFINKLSNTARRALKIQDVFTKRLVSEPIKRICREAYLTFIHGYHSASIALCRGIVEASIKDIYGLLPTDRCTIGSIIKKNQNIPI